MSSRPTLALLAGCTLWVLPASSPASPPIWQGEAPVPRVLEILAEDLNGHAPGSVSSASRPDRARAAAAFATGLHHFQQRDWARALPRLQEAADADPAFNLAPIHAALCLFLLDRADDARRLLDDALQRQPRSPELLCASAALFSLKGDWKSASLQAEASRSRLPHFLTNFHILANAAIAQNQPARIRELFRSSQQSTPPSPSPLFYTRLASLWAALLPLDGKTTPAQALREVQPFLAQAEALDPGNLLLQGQSGAVAFAAGDFALAASRLEAVYRARPNLPEIREKLALAYIQTGRPADAIPLVQAMLQDAPHRHGLHLALGELYGKIGQWDRAADAYAAYHEVGPPSITSLFALAEAQLNARRLDAALTTIRQAQRAHPTVPAFSYLRALTLLLQGQPAAALAAFSEAETLATPNHSAMLDRDFYFRKGIAAEQAGDDAAMEAAFKRCLALRPDDHETMNHLGYTWAERGQRLDEALKLIKRAVELDPENGAYLDSLGWVYYQMGDAKRALPWMLKAAAKLPDDPVILEHLGDVYAKLGLVPQALDAWTRALTKSSAPSESLRQKIQSLSPTPHQPRS